MKKSQITMLATLFAISFTASCTGNRSRIEVEDINYSDTTQYVNFSAEFQFPKGNGKARKAIREQLIQIASDQINGLMDFEDEVPSIPTASVQELLDQCASVKDSMNAMSKSDYDLRCKFILEDSDYDQQQKDEMLSYIPSWDESISIYLETDTTSYCVFSSQNYTYMGGAHGGVSGAGFLTFLKSDGSLFSNFLNDDCIDALQPLIREGLAEYLSFEDEKVLPEDLADYLFIGEGETIPLPVYEPYPCSDGLTFLYQQYEIAPYAMGMPSFTIPYDRIEPFMTDAAKKLFLK